MGLLNRPARQISWTNQLDEPAGRTSWTDQFFYLKPWPVPIFEDSPFSLYIVAASESDEGLVFSHVRFLEELALLKKIREFEKAKIVKETTLVLIIWI